jgi:hypothetical protein
MNEKRRACAPYQFFSAPWTASGTGQNATHSELGGYLGGCAKTEVVLCDGLSLSLRPRRQSSRLPTGHMPKVPVLPCLRRSTLSAA